MTIFSILIALSVSLAAAPTPPKYAAGQVWQYDTRPGEEASRLYIVHVEPLPNGEPVYHIAIDGLSIRSPQGVQTELGHAPVSQAALDASVTKLEAQDAPMPDIREGYAEWRAAFDAGGAGVFDTSAQQIVDFIEGALSGDTR